MIVISIVISALFMLHTYSGAQEEKKQREKIEVDGYWYTKFRSYGASGNETRFLSQEGLFTYGGRVEQGTNLSVSLSIGDRLSLMGRVYDLPYQERTMTFDLKAGLTHVTLGDFVASLEGGAFSNFSKKITGTMIKYQTKRLRLSALTSEAKSVTRTESFRGRNIKGPYDLRGIDLIPERLQVKLNGVVLTPDQYIIDPIQGNITFYDIIRPDDIVVITYEQQFRVTLGAGNITGVAGEYSGRSGRWNLHIAHLVEEASRQVQSALRTVSDETPEISGRELRLVKIQEDNGLLVRRGTQTTETIKKNGQTLIKYKDYNVTQGAGGMDLDDLIGFEAVGVFILEELPEADDVFTVSYTYYPDSVLYFYADEIVEIIDNTHALLQNRTIYYGTEKVEGCYQISPQNCPDILVREGINGYTVDENTNTIYLLGDAGTKYSYLRVTYRTYPSALPGSSLYDHTVTDFGIEYKLSDAISLRTDYALSESDVSSKPIQVLGMALANITAELKCPSAVTPDPCVFSLGQKNVLPDSDRIYFNDMSSPDAVKRRYVDYTINYDKGEVTFTKTIPAATTIIVDYNYSPQEIGIASGHILRFSSSYKGAKTRLNLTSQNANTYFTPIGSETNIETSRLTFSGEHTFSSHLKLNMDMLSTDTALDVLGINQQSDRKKRFELNYSTTRIPKFVLTYGKRSVSDDYLAPRTDSDETLQGMQFSLPVPFIEGCSFDWEWENKDFNELSPIATTPDSDTTRKTIGINYKRGKNFSMAGHFGTTHYNSQTFDGAAYTTTTKADNIDLKYRPIKLMDIGAKIDKQQLSDSRPAVGGSEVNATTIRMSFMPFWRVTGLNVIISKQDRPSMNTPAVSTSSTTYTGSIRVSQSVSFSPTYTITRSSVGVSSSSRGKTANNMLEYRPPGKPYFVNFSSQSGTSTTISGTAASTNSTSRNQINFGYYPAKKFSLISTLENEETRSSGAGGTFRTSLFSITADHKPSERKKHTFRYSTTKRSGTIAERYTLFNFGLSYKLSKVFSWELSWRRTLYSSPINPDQGFLGNLLETSLKAEF
ncbi:MAG: hypothetical protein AB1546_13340 [bacterium]